MMKHTTINPATGEKISTYETMSQAEIMTILDDSATGKCARSPWRGHANELEAIARARGV